MQSRVSERVPCRLVLVVFVEEVAAYGDNGNDDDPFEGVAFFPIAGDCFFDGLYHRFVLSLRGGRLGTFVGRSDETAPSFRGWCDETAPGFRGASLESTVRFAGIVAVCFVEFVKHDSVGFIGLLY